MVVDCDDHSLCRGDVFPPLYGKVDILPVPLGLCSLASRWLCGGLGIFG